MHMCITSYNCYLFCALVCKFLVVGCYEVLCVQVSWLYLVHLTQQLNTSHIAFAFNVHEIV